MMSIQKTWVQNDAAKALQERHKQEDACSKNNVQLLIGALKACSRTRNSERGKQIHAEAVECGLGCNIYIANALINMYAQCGSMVDAREAFDSMKYVSVASWNVLILGYASNGEGHTALNVFARMRTGGPAPDSVTFLGALKACTSLAAKQRAIGWADCREKGKEIHNIALENEFHFDVYVQSSLLNMYAKVGCMLEARMVFDSMKRPDVVSWTALFLGYADNGQVYTALNMFTIMRSRGPAPSVTVVAALKACSSLTANDGSGRWTECKERGKELHNIAVENDFSSDVHVQNSLLEMYAKCGSMIDAHEVFDSMKHPTVASWTALISGYAKNGQEQNALDMFTRMNTEGPAPDSVTLVAALKACSSLAMNGDCKWAECRDKCEEIHNLAVTIGSNSDIYVQNSLVDMYAKCGSMTDARAVFDSIKHPTVVSWTTLILGYADNGQSKTALDLFTRMRFEGHEPNSVTFVAGLRACTSLAVKAGVNQEECRDIGKEIHNIVVEKVCNSDVYVQSTLVDMYAKCGSMLNAHEVFGSIKHPTVVSWTALISGYADNDQGNTALDMLSRMRIEGPVLNSVTLVAALKACTSLAVKGASLANCRDRGKHLHNIAVENGCNSDVYVQNSLMDMYAKCGSMMDACAVFNGMKHPVAVSWTTLIWGYAHNGQGRNSLDMFTRMRTAEGPAPDSITIVAAIRACTSLGMKGASQYGKTVHSIAMENDYSSDVYVQNSLIDMYGKCGSMVSARDVFDGMKHAGVVAWTALVLGYAENGQGLAALDMFTRMKFEGPAADSVTFVAALKACTSLAVDDQWAKCRDRGKEIHSIAVESGCIDVYVKSTLVDMYSKCGSIVDAREVFDGMMYPGLVSWTALILGYAENGQGHTALYLFTRMQNEGPAPDSVTVGAALKACGLVGALEFGKTLHSQLDRNAFDLHLVNCLVDFYAKCGSFVEAQLVFDLHNETRDIITWNALLSGFGSCGDNEAVFELFKRMQDAGFRPDEITFLCILTCCNHAGLVVKGKECLNAMSPEYGVTPTIKHYTCIIDLFGRKNKFDDAMALLELMPCSPDEVTWMTILGACRKWRNVEIGRIAFQSLIDLNDNDAAAYVLMGQIYGSKGMVQEQEMVMGLRRNLKANREAGETCWTNEAGHVHRFMVDNIRHPQIQEIRQKWESMDVVMRQHGYSSVTRDNEKEELCDHSERLALACALIYTEPEKTVRIVKNQKICDECHTAIAIISKLELRSIICRDARRLHVFQKGKCSCGGFW